MVRHQFMKLTHEQKLRREISKARALFDRCQHALGHEPKLVRLLTSYGEAIGETQMLMQQVGVTAACTDCAEQGAGSCCFEGIESGYDSMLLLINLLMGCTIPDFREVPGSCFFVGRRGCRFQARYYFCVHYLCPALEAALGPGVKSGLLSIVGKELAAGWQLERALREFFIKKQQNPNENCVTE
jgi:hypothetical protein